MAEISTIQKAAAVIVAMGAQSAASVYKYLREDEVEQLTLEVARLPILPAETVQNTLEGFYQICLTQKVVTEGGVEYARDVLDKAFGPQVSSALLERVSKNLRLKTFDFIRKADYKNMMAILQNEHPQTVALILSYANPIQAATIISELPGELQLDIVERIATMDRASPEVIKLVEQNMEAKFASVMSVDFMEFGGVHYIANVMNNMDRATEKFIFEELSQKDQALSDEIKKLMFVFEDIILLDNRSIQRFLSEVEFHDLVLAIKGTNSDVAEKLFANMSQRMVETVKSDLEYTHNVRLSEVQSAQQRIVSVIRRLEADGELIILKGGKEEIIA